ncbi:B-cell receptor-associated protein 29-like isoform X2 [Colossoma macropomum]|uniref:B-cell receptor-associated protein 29-like isoform X2 n=1 Tax=Colossoma macropomum TaxID=42526 RepID=UPI0018646CEE|nr:B-cell receptor-associated protein 29-like isoform X2 [Colossoma macropomum]
MDLFESGKVVRVCAPMVRYSKLSFRCLVRKYGCDICFTPMIVAADFMRSVKARDSEFTTNSSDRPLIIQFAAKDAQTLADAARVVAPFSDGVDLNCGCPQRWAMAEGYGACLINKPQLVKDMVRHVKNQVDKPNYAVSIKIRIHKDLRKTVDLCQKVEAAGVSWITVHGRTAEERHQPVHYDAIKNIKDSLSIPVIANGDIKNLRDVESIHQLTGVDGMPTEMTLQWTAVALFLYVEIGILVILCLPFISPQRWQKIFNLSIWNSIGHFWNKGFLAMIIILIVLFLDAVREVRKYSGTQPSKEAVPSMYDHLHMKLFRAQRNLYISGFTLFLWLVMRRVIMLINQLAVANNTSKALHAQTEAANQAARKYMEDIELLKQAFTDNAEGEKSAQKNELLRKEVQKLTEELKISDEALKKSKSEVEAMKEQTESLTKEYDRLLQEHQILQNQMESDNKKDT